jgi:hypothetical protein
VRWAKVEPQWHGTYECPECGEEFHFERDNTVHVLDGYAQVAHVHEGDGPGVWKLSVHRHRKGQRYRADVKALQLLVAEQNRSARQQRLDYREGR